MTTSTIPNPHSAPGWEHKVARDAYATCPVKIINGMQANALVRHFAKAIHDALMAKRKRWRPASIYFERYCQDEADSAENCISEQQHTDAKAFAAAVRGEA